MSDEVLSQAEVESLLNAMGSHQEEVAKQAAQSKSIPVTLYDFKRPERVGKEQIGAIQTLHESFARNYGAALSSLLRTIVDVKLTSVDQLTYSEFIFSLENPTCLNLFNAAPLEGYLILDLSPAILYPIIDRMLGGGKQVGPIARRPLTEIELRLVGRITTIFCDELGRAWSNIVPLELSLARVESNPQLVQIVPPNEVVVVVGFELTLGETRGMMNFCIPFNTIECLGDKLSSNRWMSVRQRDVSGETTQRAAENLRGAKVEVNVELARTTITTGELLELEVGDVITTDHDADGPLTVSVAGAPKFLAKPGVFKGRKAIVVERTVAPPDDA